MLSIGWEILPSAVFTSAELGPLKDTVARAEALNVNPVRPFLDVSLTTDGVQEIDTSWLATISL
jgi:hypothetical protein